ncbi:MAG: dihydrodipicolinate synthase family protein [Rhodospirillales bacterium]|nr:dihydrodipicolinate synthase family protein [Rhodospirillales bacterium]MCW8862941.1 dihydrodipicolinate synthase family protein [Rhodospirillales bacterium]MCW8951918.1 dihydrodipicolinate synthase family protein [Rhodospirillales bacterium]MCW8970586.1 dihydrodipicolinate synthase family protein [Rhodospirillales bacterium]MCW9001789.1 dihydrodipicolinate synthase family protein [Rhodospirillales bacterium]
MGGSGFALTGVYSAVLTPQKADLSPDIEALARHCRWLLDTGCDGLAVLGTTGEANSFSVDERIAILEGIAAAGIPMAATMPGTGCCAISDTVTLTRKALELGAGGVLALPPFYYKNVSDDGLFAAFSEVIERVGDSRLKLFLYHFPQMSAAPISLKLIERLLARYPGVIAGAKDSSGDLDNMIAMARTFPGFAVFSGWDHLLKPLLAEGGAGCITAVANIASGLSRRVYDDPEGADGELAHEQLSLVRKVIADRPLIPGLKEVMARHTGNAQWRNMRPPMLPMANNEAIALMKDLEATGWRLPPVA